MALNIAVLAGDGIGIEVIREAQKVLKAAAALDKLEYRTTEVDYGGARYLRTGQVITDDEMKALRKFDAILFGAVGLPDVKPGILERGIILRLRFDFDQYINLRPVKLYEGVETVIRNKGPREINFTVIRENTEDLYCGQGGMFKEGTPDEVSTQIMLTTRKGVERCLRFAFEHCRQRKASGVGRGHLTLVHKTNILLYCADTWSRAFNEIGDKDYPDIQRAYHHVDACCMYMAARPEMYDTIVTSNMFGDIITDLGAAVAGGMGMAASGNINPDPKAGCPGMFEPVHGSAPDIAGQNKANPIAAVISLGMLLRETGKIKGDQNAVKAGERVEQAVTRVCPKFKGQSMDRLNVGTDKVGDMLVEALA